MWLISHTGNDVSCSSSKKPVPNLLPAEGPGQHHLCAKDMPGTATLRVTDL